MVDSLPAPGQPARAERCSTNRSKAGNGIRRLRPMWTDSISPRFSNSYIVRLLSPSQMAASSTRNRPRPCAESALGVVLLGPDDIACPTVGAASMSLMFSTCNLLMSNPHVVVLPADIHLNRRTCQLGNARLRLLSAGTVRKAFQRRSATTQNGDLQRQVSVPERSLGAHRTDVRSKGVPRASRGKQGQDAYQKAFDRLL